MLDSDEKARGHKSEITGQTRETAASRGKGKSKTKMLSFRILTCY